MRVSVTDHALQRWRERAAVYADAKADDLCAAFRESRRVSDDDLMPLADVPGKDYYRHDGIRAWFVVDPIAIDHVAIVTVLVDQPLAKVEPEWASRPVKVGPVKPAPPPDMPKTFANIDQHYQWAITRHRQIQLELSGLRSDNLRRRDVLEQLAWLEHHLHAIKPAYKRWRQEQHDSKMIRDDGSLNYEQALRFLLRRVEELQAEVDQLRASPSVEG